MRLPGSFASALADGMLEANAAVRHRPLRRACSTIKVDKLGELVNPRLGGIALLIIVCVLAV